ncbi:hypothetical protein [Legionella maceachernii]|nr:hypothetical protein [Legionella maceachernii]
MVKHNSSRYQTAFTTSIEAKYGVTSDKSEFDDRVLPKQMR